MLYKEWLSKWLECYINELDWYGFALEGKMWYHMH